MLIPRTVLRASVIAFALAAQAASAQTPLPKVRPMYYPRGEATADTDVFTRMINYNMYEHAMSWHQREWVSSGTGTHCTDNPGAYLWKPDNSPDFDAEDVAGRIALEAIWRGQTRSETDTTPNENVAICIVRYAMPDDVRFATRQQGLSTSGTFGEFDTTGMPNLYTNHDDRIGLRRTRFFTSPEDPDCLQMYYFRTPWMSHGITESRAWMTTFVDAYQTYTKTCGSTVYRAAIPSRFVFDQEPSLILDGRPIGKNCCLSPLSPCHDGLTQKLTDDEQAITWQDMLDYWAALQLDGRFGSGTESGTSTSGEPVPGCGGKTLWRLWWEARHPTVGDAVPTPGAMGSYPDDYQGGSADNQKWYTWFSSINQQAYIGAMDEAAFQVVHAKWPGCMSSDYEGSMRTSAYLMRSSPGALGGPTGISYPVQTQFGYRPPPESSTLTTSPMEAGVLNALHFYSDVSSYHWLKWRAASRYPLHAPYTIQRWGNTGGTNEYTYGLTGDGWQSPLKTGDSYASDGDEFWEATSLRVNNFELSNCFRSNLPSGDYNPAAGMAAWITLPHQPLATFGLEDGQEYNGLTYDNFVYMPMRQSAYSLYRTVADCRMHGVNEFMVWNDTGRDADADWDPVNHPDGPWGANEGNYAHRGLHADRPANWNILKQVMHQVYAYDCTVEGIRGIFDSDMSYSSSAPYFVERLRYADQDDDDTSVPRAVKVAPQTTPTPATARIQLKFTPNGVIDTSGNCINFEIRLKTHISASVKVELFEVDNGNPDNPPTWVRLGTASDPFVNDLDGKYFNNYDFPTNTDFRTIRFRLPRTIHGDGRSLINATTKEVNIRVTGIVNSSNESPKITIDNAICYLSDTHHRTDLDSDDNPGGPKFIHPADLNADGIVDSKDDDLFTLLSSYTGSSETAPIYRYFIDFDRDGDVNADSADQATWSGTNGIYNPDSTVFIDAHRYSMVDLAMISSTACIADVGTSGGVAGQDGKLDNNDFIAFIDYFFTHDSHADIGIAGGLPGSDGYWDNNDFIAFINYFFAGCQH